jgi:hypothetical protein
VFHYFYIYIYIIYIFFYKEYFIYIYIYYNTMWERIFRRATNAAGKSGHPGCWLGRYTPNQQPATVGEEERGGKDTTSSRTTTGAVPELNPPKSACDGDTSYTVLRTITRGTVPMEQFAGCHRGQHLTVHISTNDLHC